MSGEAPTGTTLEFTLESTYFGGFTSANAEEVLATFVGCEPHGNNWGGTVLLRKVAGAWAFQRYEQGFRPKKCLVFGLADGRSLAVCLGGYAGMGESAEWIETYDAAAPEGYRSVSLVSVSSGACASPLWHSQRIERFESIDVDNDSTPDLRVTVVSGEADVADPSSANCPPDVDPPTKPYTLDFHFDRHSFQGIPQTLATIRSLTWKESE